MYGAVITALLFLAFAFFAVAQAAAVRNAGQSAADAAALAAAQDDRERFFDGFLDAVHGDDDWQNWLHLTEVVSPSGCGAAADFAGRNDSDVVACEPVLRHGDPGYTVRIRTRFDTGDTFLPGADHRHGEAEATAVVRPRCDLEGDGETIDLICGDAGDVTIDPDSDEPHVKPSDLFSVVLVG
jgi:hypothetical protein